jgi:hypothetical protein
LLTWDDFPGPARPRLEALRARVAGETKLLDENFLGQAELGWCRRNIAKLQIAPCGPAGHLASEDQPLPSECDPRMGVGPTRCSTLDVAGSSCRGYAQAVNQYGPPSSRDTVNRRSSPSKWT